MGWSNNMFPRLKNDSRYSRDFFAKLQEFSVIKIGKLEKNSAILSINGQWWRVIAIGKYLHITIINGEDQELLDITDSTTLAYRTAHVMSKKPVNYSVELNGVSPIWKNLLTGR
jgi:hypothetical protein